MSDQESKSVFEFNDSETNRDGVLTYKRPDGLMCIFPLEAQFILKEMKQYLEKATQDEKIFFLRAINQCIGRYSKKTY